MSLIKMIKAQLGLSITPANNFTLDASADNGTMKLVRGNAGATTQDIMTVDATGEVAFPLMPLVDDSPIVESGTWNGSDRYVKFADGTCIVTFRYTGALPTSAAYGSGLYLKTLTPIGLPFPILSNFTLSGSGGDNAVPGWVSGNPISTTMWSMQYFTSTASVTGTAITIQILGVWK